MLTKNEQNAYICHLGLGLRFRWWVLWVFSSGFGYLILSLGLGYGLWCFVFKFWVDFII